MQIFEYDKYRLKDGERHDFDWLYFLLGRQFYLDNPFFQAQTRSVAGLWLRTIDSIHIKVDFFTSEVETG
jgi:hypothetical protein